MISILFRSNSGTAEEENICSKYFPIKRLRTECWGELIISRYSCLPYYKELEDDLKNRKCSLINSYEQHKWIANFEWYEVLKDYTFQTWTDADFYLAPESPYIVKGRTNSRKFKWDDSMYAPNKKAALMVANELMGDSLIGPQGVIYRQYIPLKTFEIGVNGLPITKEFRFFYYKSNLLEFGYYWCNAKNTNIKCPIRMIFYANEIAEVVSKYCNFFVLDVAETETGKFTLIEINDGQMSGLSCCNPSWLYNNLRCYVL